MIRDWYPLVTADRCVSWLIYLQIRLRFQLLAVDLAAAPHTSAANYSSAERGKYYQAAVNGTGDRPRGNSGDGQGTKGGKHKHKKSSFLGQLEDFF